MKKLLIILALSLSFKIHAQTYLQVGDKAPSLQGCKWILGEPVTGFKKEKIYVLVFGASWSGTYLSRIPDLGLVAEEHRSDFEMLTFFIHEQIGKGTGPYGEKVERFIKRTSDQFKCSVAIDDKEATLQHAWLIDDMQQNALPLFVVVDGDGMIAWTGNGLPALKQAVSRVKGKSYLLSDEISNARAEEERKGAFDDSKLYLVNNNGGPGDAFVFRSLIARYDGKIAAPMPESIQDLTGIIVDSLIHAGRLQMMGAPLTTLYYVAYGDTIRTQNLGRNSVTYLFSDTVANPHQRSSYGRWWHKPLLEVSNASPFVFNRKSPANRYNYSLQVPPALGTATFMKQVMQRDLMNYFGYNVTVETRGMPYWKVTIGDKLKVKKQLIAKRKDKPFTTDSDGEVFRFRNADMRDVISTLAILYGYESPDYSKIPLEEQLAFIDETEIAEPIDFDFNPKLSFEAWREYLASKGLVLTRSVKPMKVVVIRDPAL